MHPADQRACIVAVWSELSGKWLFAKSYSCLFGIGSVVVSFNRLPALATAVSKRLGICMCAAYFDDLITLESLNFRTSARPFLLLVLTALGAPPTPAKSFPAPSMARQRAQFGDKGVIWQSRVVRTHQQRHPLSEDRQAGQQRYKQDVSAGSECTFSKPGNINCILKASRWFRTMSKLLKFLASLVSAAPLRAFFRQV